MDSWGRWGARLNSWSGRVSGWGGWWGERWEGYFEEVGVAGFVEVDVGVGGVFGLGRVSGG